MSVRSLIILNSSPPSAQPDFAITPPGLSTTEKTPPPSKFYDGQVIPNSSSSDLPSPSDFWRVPVDRRLKTDSCAEYYPQNAMAGFRTPSGLVKDRHLSSIGGLEQEKEYMSKPPNQKATNRRQQKAVINTESSLRIGEKQAAQTWAKAAPKKRALKAKAFTDAEPKRPRKRSTKNKEDGANDTVPQAQFGYGVSPPAENKKRKRKAAKAPTAECVVKTAQDSRKSDVSKSCKSKKKTGKVSSHFETGSKHEVLVEAPNASESSVQLNLFVAARRRRDWTPVEDTITNDKPTAELSIHGLSVSPTIVPTSMPAKTSFSSLKDFAYVEKPRSISPERMPPSDAGLNKRRKIEV
jgi:hypothetical protein